MASTLRTASRLRTRLVSQPRFSQPTAHPARFPPGYLLFPARNVSTDVKMRASEGAKKRSSISDVIKQDHRELEMYYKQIVSSSDADVRTRYRNQFVWELARHAIGEELVVYPQFEELLIDGKKIADDDRAQHQKVIQSATSLANSSKPM
jgi:hemerythrin superfamily protein